MRWKRSSIRNSEGVISALNSNFYSNGIGVCKTTNTSANEAGKAARGAAVASGNAQTVSYNKDVLPFGVSVDFSIPEAPSNTDDNYTKFSQSVIFLVIEDGIVPNGYYSDQLTLGISSTLSYV